MLEGLELVNAAMKARGVRLKLVAQAGLLYARGTITRSDGVRSRQRVALSLPATTASLLEAETRILALAQSIQATGCLVEPLPWVVAAPVVAAPAGGAPALTVGVGVEALKRDFWLGKVQSSAAERTWDRISAELKRLPPGAKLTTDLLVAVAASTVAGSRTRLESCKVFKRLGKLAGLEGLERLDAIRTPYEPGQRELPGDETLLEILERTRSHPAYGWCTAALAVYGCRPAEVFSLSPAGDGTARVLTVKRKGRLPLWRTALALPKSWVEQFQLLDITRRWDCTSPSTYDSLESRRLTQAWGKWFVAQAPGLQLYDLRHGWAVRSIRKNLNASLAAKTMGHSLAVHHSTYHQWLEQSDVAAAAALL